MPRRRRWLQPCSQQLCGTKHSQATLSVEPCPKGSTVHLRAVARAINTLLQPEKRGAFSSSQHAAALEAASTAPTGK